MCFRFDGQYAVTAHKRDKCRERALPAVSSEAPQNVARGKVSELHRVPGSEQTAAATLPVDSGVEPTLLSATMKTALILVGKRVGKAV